MDNLLRETMSTAECCECCLAAPVTCWDPHIGAVCAECFSLLHSVELMLRDPHGRMCEPPLFENEPDAGTEGPEL